MQKFFKLHWLNNDTPFSKTYDDIYFSKESGLEESKYVFLDGNDLSNRWQDLTKNFCIIETGFGTGLNFLNCLRLYKSQTRKFKLYFYSIEKYPLIPQDIKHSLSVYTELEKYTAQLIDLYDGNNIVGNILSMDFGGIELKILIGDIKDVIFQVDIKADAWFLDGFAPSKNPDMWSSQLYSNMAALTNPKGSFATYTSSGMVRKGLTEHGFLVSKAKGFGNKRHMLKGFLP